ncbi:MAG: CPXCG motif-containing cysteine-rich protein [Gammaproteobacteria bacterium]|nr:CPXCG motif-containing cysteine-rich protein [Gammaproteobacteria bacterium]
MISLENKTIQCPHCGHQTHIEVDSTNGDQDYYEECANCCQELHIKTHIDEVKQKVDLSFDADDEQFY